MPLGLVYFNAESDSAFKVNVEYNYIHLCAQGDITEVYHEIMNSKQETGFMHFCS